MTYNDTTNGLGIIQDVEYRTGLGEAGISGDTYLMKMFTTWANNAYSRAFHIIMTANKKWTLDDANHTDRPVATTPLVSGQHQYTILSATPGTAKNWLQVKRVEIITDDDIQVLLPATSLDQIKKSVGETYKTDGSPSLYYFDGASIFLQTAPNYNKDAGLKIWFARSPLFFSTSDTTKRPGFATIFHDYIPTFMAYMWEKYKNVGNSEQTMRDMQIMESAIAKHYSEIDRTLRPTLNRNYKSFK